MGDDNRRTATSSSSTSTNLLGAVASTTRSGRTSPGVDPARVPLKSGVKESARIGQGASNVVDVQSTQMTWIFFLVSLIAVIFLAPFVVLRSLQVSYSLNFHLYRATSKPQRTVQCGWKIHPVLYRLS
jgi:hypothetical protein